MGISTKSIKFGHAFCYVIMLFCIAMPALVKAQDGATDKITTVNGKKYYIHTVGKNETIYGIAQKYSLQPKDIVLENPSAIDGVKTGDVLLIPIVAAPKPGDTSTVANSLQAKQGTYFYHDVLEKETLYSLSKKYNTTVSAIDSLNPEITVKGLLKGQKIRIPIVPAAPSTIRDTTKTVQSKTTLTKPIHRDTVIVPKATTNTQIKKTTDETNAYKNLVTQQTQQNNPPTMPVTQDTGKKLSRYNIALILPFAGNSDSLRLNRLLEGTEQVPRMTQIAVDYYHGIIMAFDTLAKKGFKANLHIYNILQGSDTSSRLMDSILTKPEMAAMNLIIGPPSPSHFKRMALFADKHHIPLVSPLSSENSVLKNNPWASKTIPSDVTQMEAMADYISSHFMHANIIVIHNRVANDEYYEVFRKRFRKADSALGNTDSLRRSESTGGVTSLATKIMKNNMANVVVVPYLGEAFVAKFINELANSSYAFNDSLVLFGMSNWTKNDALAADNLDTLNFHFPSNEYVNYADSATRKFIAKYRNHYLSEPSKYSYEGYDAGMFYGTLLRTYGTDMQNHLGDIKYRGIQTSFDMFRTSPSNGYENKTVYMLEYKNYTEKLDSR